MTAVAYSPMLVTPPRLPEPTDKSRARWGQELKLAAAVSRLGYKEVSGVELIPGDGGDELDVQVHDERDGQAELDGVGRIVSAAVQAVDEPGVG